MKIGVLHRVLDTATILVGLVALAIVALQFGGRVVGSLDDGAAADAPRLVEAWESYLDRGHWLGPRDASVVLIEWGDYQCPACRSFHRHVKAVQREYPDDFALVYRHFPLGYHQLAFPAARAAECAAHQGAFQAFHTRLLEDPNWLGDAMTRFATDAGVADLSAFTTCLESTALDGLIQTDMEALRSLEGRGTPSLILNGIFLSEIPDSTALARMVKELVG